MWPCKKTFHKIGLAWACQLHCGREECFHSAHDKLVKRCCVCCSDERQCTNRVHRKFSTISSRPADWWQSTWRAVLPSSYGIKCITCSVSSTFGLSEPSTPFSYLSLVMVCMTLYDMITHNVCQHTYIHKYIHSQAKLESEAWAVTRWGELRRRGN